VQVQDDARTGLARGGERAPPQPGQQVVGVDDPRSGALDGVRHLPRIQPAPQQPGGGPRPAEAGAVALEHRHRPAEVLAHEPLQVLDHPFLAAGGAVAVMNQQDHVAR